MPAAKSEYAENRALQMGKKREETVNLSGSDDAFWAKMRKRIERHRQLRAGKGFETVERYTAVEAIPRRGENGPILKLSEIRLKGRL